MKKWVFDIVEGVLGRVGAMHEMKNEIFEKGRYLFHFGGGDYFSNLPFFFFFPS